MDVRVKHWSADARRRRKGMVVSYGMKAERVGGVGIESNALLENEWTVRLARKERKIIDNGK